MRSIVSGALSSASAMAELATSRSRARIRSLRNTVVPASILVIIFGLGLSVMRPTRALAMCTEDNGGGPCQRNGCPGTFECLGGRIVCVIDAPCTPPSSGPDTLTLQNTPTVEVGVLVDGKSASGEVDDARFLANGNGGAVTITLPALSASTDANEVISFASGRAPTRSPTPWTNGQDNFVRNMEASVTVPITLWILVGPFANEAVAALSAAAQAGVLYEQERVGLDWSLVEVRNATQNPGTPNLLNITGANFGQLEGTIGHVQGRINVYWVATVNGGTGNGLGEVSHGDTVAVGHFAAAGLLAHEIGHNLALDHTDGDSRFGTTNIMQSAGGTRQFMTEGQAYRAHIRSISAIRSTQVYGLRPAMPIIDTCDITSTTRTCPKADKRIWADGMFLPN